MPGIVALTILFIVYAVSEIIALRTRAVLSTVLGISVILTIGFWSGLFPKDIIKIAQIPGMGMLTVGMLIVSLGTTIDFAEMKREWKVVATSMAAVVISVAAIILIGQHFIDAKLAIAGSPIFAGGNAATLIMLDGAKKKGIEYVATFCLVLLVTQKFFGIPVASMMLRRLAKRLRTNADFIAQYSQEKSANEAKKPMKLPSLFDRPSVYLAKLGIVASIAFYASKATGGKIHFLVMCLLMGMLFYALGFLESGILKKTESSGFIIFLVTVVIFTTLGNTTPAQVVSVLPPLIVTAVLGVAGVFLSGFLCSLIFHLPFELCVSLGITCTFGFPTTMLVSQEVSEAIGQNEQERTALLNYLLPKMLVAGFVTVTITSVLLAGVVVNIL
jgi:hypothetical protein